MLSLRINKTVVILGFFVLLLGSIGNYYQNKLGMLTADIERLSADMQLLAATKQQVDPIAMVSMEQITDPVMTENKAKVKEIVWELLSKESPKAKDHGFSIVTIESVDEEKYDAIWGIAHWAYFSAESGFIGWDLVIEDCRRYLDDQVNEETKVLLEALIEVGI